MKEQKKLKLAIVGTDSMHGKEIKDVLSQKEFPAKKMEFFDPHVEEDYSKLTEFQGDPQIVQSIDEEKLSQADLVFLAADPDICKKLGALAVKKRFHAIDLSGTFNRNPKVPVVVAGINDEELQGNKPYLVANPHPVTIILSHLFFVLLSKFGLTRALSFVLQPASVFGEQGIAELASQSLDIMNGVSLKKTVFKTQAAFNLLSQVEPSDDAGFTSVERQISQELGRIFGGKSFPFSLSIIQAPVFHTYSIMSYVEMEKKAGKRQIEDLFKTTPSFQFFPPSPACPASCISAAGKEEIYASQIKVDESSLHGFWIWTVADNLTLGSALNAWQIACRFIPSGNEKP